MNIGNIFYQIANLFKAKNSKVALNNSVFKFPAYPTMKVPNLKFHALVQGVDGAENTVLSDIASVCQSAFNHLESRGLSKSSIRDYVKHMPPSNNNNVNDIIEPCLHVLYQYSKEQEYIQRDLSYQDFRTLHW